MLTSLQAWSHSSLVVLMVFLRALRFFDSRRTFGVIQHFVLLQGLTLRTCFTADMMIASTSRSTLSFSEAGTRDDVNVISTASLKSFHTTPLLYQRGFLPVIGRWSDPPISSSSTDHGHLSLQTVLQIVKSGELPLPDCGLCLVTELSFRIDFSGSPTLESPFRDRLLVGSHPRIDCGH